jgi:hypothetical protein
MAVAVTYPANNPNAALSGTNGRVSRVDDTRALKRRIRRLTFTGNFGQAAGETVTALQVGLSRFVGVNPLGGTVSALDQATANEYSIKIADDRKSVVIKLYENAAAGSPSGLKTDAEAHLTGAFLDVEFIGF